MADFLIVPGGGGAAWPWHLVVSYLVEQGHRAVAVDLPADDESAGLDRYVRVAQEAAADAGFDAGIIAVGHSLGGFTAPLLSQVLPVRAVVLYNAMIPNPGERADEWWEKSGFQARADARERSVEETFFNGVDPELAKAAMAHDRDQSGAPMRQPWPRTVWPDVPTRVLISTDDKFFAREFMQRLARLRLGVDADEMSGGHMSMLSHPRELATRLVSYANNV